MASDLQKYLDLQNTVLTIEKKRLGFIRDSGVQVRKQLKECMLV